MSPEATVFEAIQKFAEKNIGAVLVVKDGKLEGIFSERDYARKLILKGQVSKESIVGDFMTKNVVTVTPDANVFDCMNLMTEKHFRHLPVSILQVVFGSGGVGKSSVTLRFVTDTFNAEYLPTVRR